MAAMFYLKEKCNEKYKCRDVRKMPWFQEWRKGKTNKQKRKMLHSLKVAFNSEGANAQLDSHTLLGAFLWWSTPQGQYFWQNK